MFCCNISVEFLSSSSVLSLDCLKLFFCTEVDFVHLNLRAVVSLRYDYLIICILFGGLGAEAEVRRLCIYGMQTILTCVFLSVNENPSLSILSGVAVAFEVSAVDVPSAPVTTRIRSCIVTCCQSVEERIGLVEGTEDDVGVTIGIR